MRTILMMLLVINPYVSWGGCNDPRPIVVHSDRVSLVMEPCGTNYGIDVDFFDFSIVLADKGDETDFSIQPVKLDKPQNYLVEIKAVVALEEGDNLVSYRARSVRLDTVPGNWEQVILKYIPKPPPPKPVGQFTVTEIIEEE